MGEKQRIAIFIWGMGLLGVVTTLAMWNSDEFESHMLHHSNHGVLEAHLRGAERSGSNPAWGIKDESFAKVLSLIKDFASCFFGHGFSKSKRENGSGSFE